MGGACVPEGPRQAPQSWKARLSIRLAWLLGWFWRLLPRAVDYWLADRAGDAVYWLVPAYRRNVTANLSRVLGPDADPDHLAWLTRQVFRTSARNFCDLLLVPSISMEQFRASITVTGAGWQRLDNALDAGRGVVMITAHLGAFDSVGQILAANGYPVTVLISRTVPEFIDIAVTHLRACRGLRLESANTVGIRRIINRLRQGEVAAFVADRDFVQRGWPVRFFGEPTTLPIGPVRLARSSGAPILPIFARRLSNGYQLDIGEPFYVPRTDDIEADLRAGLAHVVDVFERRIRRAPEQWVMFQRVWPDAPPPGEHNDSPVPEPQPEPEPVRQK